MMNWIRVFKLSAVLLGAAAASGQAAAQWTVTTLDRAGASTTQLWGINDHGSVVGSDSLGGFVYSGGVATALSGIANATAITPFGISDSGTIVGSWTETVDANTTITHGFIDQGGTYTTWDIPLAGGSFTQIRSISLDGRYLAGYYGSTATSLGQGFAFDTVSSQLQTYTSSGQMILQGSNSSGLTTGSVAGGAAGTAGGVLAFQGGSYTTYPGMPGIAGRPSFRGVNDSGMMTGYTSVNGLTTAIFGSVPNGYSFATLAIAGAATSVGEGLNNGNSLVGFYTDANGDSHGFLAAPVPEPASALLFAVGLAAVAGVRQRRTAGSGALRLEAVAG